MTGVGRPTEAVRFCHGRFRESSTAVRLQDCVFRACWRGNGRMAGRKSGSGSRKFCRMQPLPSALLRPAHPLRVTLLLSTLGCVRSILVELDLNWLLMKWLYWWHQRDDSFTCNKTCETDWSQLNVKTKGRYLLSSLLSHQNSPWFNIRFA